MPTAAVEQIHKLNTKNRVMHPTPHWVRFRAERKRCHAVGLRGGGTGG